MTEPSSSRGALRPVAVNAARGVGLLLVAGGALGILSVALPHPAALDGTAVLATAVPMVAAGALVRSVAGRVPLAMSHALLALTSLLAGVLTLEAGIATGIYGSIWVWGMLVAGYFFARPSAFAHLAWMLLVYAATLALVPSAGGFSPVTRWLFSAILLLVILLFVSSMVDRRARADRRARRFFELSQDLLCTLDEQGRIVDVNGAWERRLGYTAEELRGTLLLDLAHPDDRDRAVAAARGVFEGRSGEVLENRVFAKDGSVHWLRSSADVAAEDGMLYARASDITELKRVAAERERLLGEVQELARRDALTGLPNRYALDEQLPRELARTRRAGADLCLALIDLDRFKDYNDAQGHLAGDEMLRRCAAAWEATLRVSDLLVRFGGEEFLAVLPDCPPAEAEEVVERLRAATPGAQTCSVGLALWDGEESVEGLIARADAALYTAKAGGRDRLVQA